PGEEGRMPVEQQPPLVLAMVLADTVVQDLPTGKNTIQGTYRALDAADFPYVHPSMVVYVALTEGYGPTEVRLRLSDAHEPRPPLFEQEATVEFPDPLAEVEVVFAHRNIVFPEPGEYRLQLFGAGEPLRERRLDIHLESNLDES